jgi:hypothetical protein
MRNYHISVVEPAKTFHEMLDVISHHVAHDSLTLRVKYDCRLDQLPPRISARDVDWFFIANAITPLVAQAGDVPRAVTGLHSVINAVRRPQSTGLITIAENTNSVVFPDFCSELNNHGIPVAVSDHSCNAPWLADCQFYVTGPRRLTRPRLRLALATTPEGTPAA